MDPYWATVWTVGIPVITIALIFLDFGPEKDPWKRPIFTSIAIMAFIQFVVFSLLIIANQANIDQDPPYWFAHIILMITIGEFWHWALYRQFWPMAVWVAFNLVSGIFYLFHWHVISADWLYQWVQMQGQVDWNPTNLYWNFLWAGYAIIQAIVFAGLWFHHQRKVANEQRQEEARTLKEQGAL
jgi:hypothetical protein